MDASANRLRRDALRLLAATGLLPWLPGCGTPPAATALPATASANGPGTDPPAGAAARLPPLPEPADPALPSLLLIGDSTVRNGWDDGQQLGPAGQWGWGRVIERLLDTGRINVVNRAIGGLSSRTYRTGGHWARTRAFVKPGDVVAMQFGHNDGSPVNDTSRARGTLRGTGPETETIDNLLTRQRETVATYGAYLRGYVAEIRALQAVPVICSPVPRKRFDAQGRTQRSAGSHADWAREVAAREQVAFVDLEAGIADRYDALGAAVVDQLFPRAPEDRVHTNWAGAALNAQVALAGLRAQRLLPEAAFLPAPAAAAAPSAGPSVATALAAPPRRLPTLFAVGDSTVRSAGVGGHWGWADVLAERLDGDRIRLANHAMAGRSTRTYLREGRWQAVRALLQPGDLVLIQFGHNDGGRIGDPAAKQRGVLPGTGPETTEEAMPDGTREAVASFGAYLARYVREALAAGAVPVILSPVPHKDRWQGERDFAEFAAWGHEVARREGRYFADLTMLVTAAYRDIGAAAVDALFSDARTHTNEAGARLNARCVAQALAGLPGQLAAPYLRV